MGIFSLLMLGIIGLPVPDETLLTLSGYLIFHGELKLIPTFFSAFLGSIAGISISYAIGSTFGHHILIKYGHYIHITEDRMEKAHLWFEKIGRWSLLVGYFIPGVRHVVAIFAGTSELQMWE
ncbi:MAG: DedA family protein, partial [Ignavibacteriaceae bacterium]|nr:DedA family protein [Ignavibacteriaceae bacterium]